MPKQPNTFIADALALKLRFRFAEIAKRTGMDKATVKAYVIGRKKPTKSFLIRFYAAFRNELADIGITGSKGYSANDKPPPDIAYLHRINRLLHKQLETSNAMLESSKRIEQKLDELLKWRSYGGQLWEKN